MKRTKRIYVLLTAVLIGSCTNTFGQAKERTPGKHSIHFEFYQPLRIPAMGEFYSDDWYFDLFPSSMPPDTDFDRKYFSGAFGLRYDRILGKGFILKARAGFSYRKLKEHYYSDFHNQNATSDDYIYDHDFTYGQVHVNSFLGVSKRIILNKRFFIDVGPQLAYVHYKQSESNFVTHMDDYAGTDAPVMVQDIRVNIKYNPVDLVGVGSKAELSMRLTDRLTSTLGFQAYCFLMLSKGAQVTGYHATSTDAPNGTTSEINEEWRLNQNIIQTGFSNVSPVVSIGYSF